MLLKLVMAETGDGFSACRHTNAVAMQVSYDGPWRPLFSQRVAGAERLW